eukprot:5950908-Heterocapsa_arctica.AAC.1
MSGTGRPGLYHNLEMFLYGQMNISWIMIINSKRIREYSEYSRIVIARFRHVEEDLQTSNEKDEA